MGQIASRPFACQLDQSASLSASTLPMPGARPFAYVTVIGELLFMMKLALLSWKAIFSFELNPRSLQPPCIAWRSAPCWTVGTEYWYSWMTLPSTSGCGKDRCRGVDQLVAGTDKSCLSVHLVGLVTSGLYQRSRWWKKSDHECLPFRSYLKWLIARCRLSSEGITNFVHCAWRMSKARFEQMTHREINSWALHPVQRISAVHIEPCSYFSSSIMRCADKTWRQGLM